MDNDTDNTIQKGLVDPTRERVSVQVGAYVEHANKIYRIEKVLDFESVLGVEVISGRSELLPVMELRSVIDEKDAKEHYNIDIAEISDKDWAIAETRFASIKPLLGREIVGKDDVKKRAKEVGCGSATLYRWLSRYKAYGVLSSLIPQRRGWKEGNSRINDETEKIIHEVIKDVYLTKQRPTKKKTVIEVRRKCMERGIIPPSDTAVFRRINKIPQKERLIHHGFREEAKNKFSPVAGRFPNADYPLSVVQIDHTPADIILVDDAHRKPIGRPWITLAVDVYSRMVTGYYLSFDPPSETSVGMCVAHSVLAKDEWLLLHHIDAEWPVWGFPKTIHVDNGADFRSNNFRQSCEMHGIELEFRPVRQPRYGGHIERILGTLLREIHNLPGTTFSSIKERSGYDSEKQAVMTISEFETWLVSLICNVYHKRMHSSIGMTPRRKWEIGVFGNADVQGVGLPPRPADKLSILLDFLPSFRRTIQAFGVTIDGMKYYAEALRPWINAENKATGKKQDFVFRRDPRDISAVWFFDPTLKQYYKIPFADQSLPVMSIWEYQQVRTQLKKEGAESVNEHQIMRALTELRDSVEEAAKKTKKARMLTQRRRDHVKKAALVEKTPLEKAESISDSTSNSFSDFSDGEIEAFGDIS